MPNKLGPHGLDTTDAARLWASRANITKQAFGVDLLRTAQPGALQVCRPIWRLRNDDGAQAARDIIALYDQWGWRPPITELWNEGDEIGQRLYSGLELRVQRTQEAVAIFHANGLKVAGFSFSTGVPEPADWQYVRDNGFAGVDYVAIHEYWGNEGLSTWNALRYRRVHDILSGNHPPFIITECGRDAVEGGASGWRISGISASQYVAELLAYDAELSRDSYVLGATVFTTGGGSGWGNFDVDELVPLIVGSGPGPSRYNCIGGQCITDPNGPYDSLSACQAACGGPGPGPGGGDITPVLVAGAVAVGLVVVALIARDRAGKTVYRDVKELQPGEPIPPGYQVIR